MRANLTRTAGSVLLAAAVTVGFAPAALASVGPEDSPAASTATAAATAAAPAANAPRAAQSPSQVLESTPWQTTGAVDQDGKKVALDHPGVANYVGWAYYKADGTFTMYNLDDSPKMHGEWSVDAEGKTRTLVAKNDAGEVLFTRVVPLVELTASTFTYRVFPDAADQSTYFDIIHTPTKHAEPSAPEKPVDPETPGTDEPGTETPENPEQPGTDEPGAETPGAESPEQPSTDAPQDQDRAPVDEVPADTIPAADAPTAGDVADDNTANEADAAEDAAVEQGELARTGAEGPVAITAAALFALMGGAGAFVAARRRSAA
jgi:LPXTG-motif cell wall-anchored protein